MRIFIALFLALALGVASGQPAKDQAPPAAGVAGIWLGVLKIGPVNLRLAFELKEADDGTLSGTLTSLDQGRAEIPCKTVSFEGAKLTVELPAVAARYEGRLDAGAGAIHGTFEQRGTPIPLDLRRVEKLPTANRPQYPKKPYPYDEKDVTFPNAAAGIELAGTLTVPRGDGPFPGVVLVTGSGPQDRDETVFEHKPFLVIADYLTRQGFAVLRYDDRGFGKSGGAFAGATTADFASDAHAALEYLASRPGVDREKVGVIGHSEGAVAAEIVAADHPKDVAFIVLLAGYGVSGEQLALAQSLDVVRSAGGSDADAKLGGDLLRALIPIAKGPGDADEVRPKLVAAAAEFIGRIEDEGVRSKMAGSEQAIANRLADPWVRFFFGFDSAATLGRVKCPVLALAGARDVQVRSRENLDAISRAVRGGGNAEVTAVELEGLNHLFQTCRTGAVEEYGTIEETFSPKALDVVAKWLSARVIP